MILSYGVDTKQGLEVYFRPFVPQLIKSKLFSVASALGRSLWAILFLLNQILMQMPLRIL